MIKPLMLWFVLLLGLFPLISLSGQGKQTHQAIYIQQAAMAMIKPDKNGRGQYKLVLMDVGNQVAHFSGPRWRQGYLIALDRFVQSWQPEQLGKKRHAAIVGRILSKRHAEKSKSFHFMLSAPSYSSMFNNLTYTVTQPKDKLDQGRMHIKHPTLLIY